MGSGYFDPRDGSPQGAPDYGWSTLVMDSILRRVFGIIPRGDHVELDPHLPDSWDAANIGHLFTLGTTLALRYARLAGSLSLTVSNRGGRPIEIRRGNARVRLDPRRSARL